MNDLRAHLEAIAAGKGRRPRGNAVTAAEHAAVARFAKASHGLVNDSIMAGHDPDRTAADSERVIPPPPEALPPLP